MKQGDVVLIWGASGGLGGYATQLALNGGAIPVCVVSSPEKAELCRRMGADLVIDRATEDFRFWKDDHEQDTDEWRRFGERVRALTGGDDPDIVFEHPGRETFGVSVYVAAFDVHRNAHQGKVAVRCLAPEEGLGVRDPELRSRHEMAINRFRGSQQGRGR
jgi:NADPH:quinone reductase-like Zn-dependent oxidoreductase